MSFLHGARDDYDLGVTGVTLAAVQHPTLLVTTSTEVLNSNHPSSRRVNRAPAPGGAAHDPALWEYLDPKHRLQGPFPASKILQWHHARHDFAASIQLRRCGEAHWRLFAHAERDLRQDAAEAALLEGDSRPAPAAPPAARSGVASTATGQRAAGSHAAQQQAAPLSAAFSTRPMADLRQDEPVVRRLFTAGRADPANQPRWLYTDEQGAVQGPFHAFEMAAWCLEGYFEQLLPMCGIEADVQPEMLPQDSQGSIYHTPLRELLDATSRGQPYSPWGAKDLRSWAAPATRPEAVPGRPPARDHGRLPGVGREHAHSGRAGAVGGLGSDALPVAAARGPAQPRGEVKRLPVPPPHEPSFAGAGAGGRAPHPAESLMAQFRPAPDERRRPQHYMHDDRLSSRGSGARHADAPHDRAPSRRPVDDHEQGHPHPGRPIAARHDHGDRSHAERVTAPAALGAAKARRPLDERLGPRPGAGRGVAGETGALSSLLSSAAGLQPGGGSSSGVGVLEGAGLPVKMPGVPGRGGSARDEAAVASVGPPSSAVLGASTSGVAPAALKSTLAFTAAEFVPRGAPTPPEDPVDDDIDALRELLMQEARAHAARPPVGDPAVRAMLFAGAVREGLQIPQAVSNDDAGVAASGGAASSASDAAAVARTAEDIFAHAHAPHRNWAEEDESAEDLETAREQLAAGPEQLRALPVNADLLVRDAVPQRLVSATPGGAPAAVARSGLGDVKVTLAVKDEHVAVLMHA